MTEKELKKFITKSGGDRTKLINDLLDALHSTVADAQKALLQRFIRDWVDKLDTDENGKIKNTLRNKRMLSTVDAVFSDYVKTEGVVIAKAMVDGINKILDFNGKYYKGLNGSVDLVPINSTTQEFIKSWLGLKGNGALEGNGYLAKTISDPKILGELKNVALRSVMSQQGMNDTKQTISDFIQGNKEQAGLLERYHRNFVYDTYSQVDRVAAGLYADRLDLNYAIYEGGIIKTTRPFCRARNGKVFTREEIATMQPAGSIPPNYNPFTDMGGYGCRHHWNWIPYEVAILYRPDLKEAA